MHRGKQWRRTVEVEYELQRCTEESAQKSVEWTSKLRPAAIFSRARRPPLRQTSPHLTKTESPRRHIQYREWQGLLSQSSRHYSLRHEQWKLWHSAVWTVRSGLPLAVPVWNHEENSGGVWRFEPAVHGASHPRSFQTVTSRSTSIQSQVSKNTHLIFLIVFSNQV